jgi:TolB-like protein/Flp pilus assembly protein TadD
MSGGALETPRGRPAPHKASADVFISYASYDKTVADVVCKAFENAGLTCWIAPRDVTPGEFYAESIVHAIDSAKAVVLVLSQNTTVSQHVLREIERASSKRRPVVALRIDLAPLPAGLEYFLNTSQWLDASAIGVDSALPKLIDAVRNALAQPSTATRANPQPSVAKNASRRPGLVLVASAVIIATALAYVVIDRVWLSEIVDQENQLAEMTPAASVVSPVALSITDKSIAVLPFVDMSETKDQDYFSDGISEELMNLLAKIPELRVIARTSSFSYKGKEVDIGEIARQLNVAHVLEGSVRKSGNKLRITAQLVRTSDSRQLWSESFDRPLDDIFVIQDEIAGAVVEQLKIKLLSPVPKVQKANPDAYALFLQALQSDREGTDAGMERSISLYEQALAIDPTYAAAWNGLAGAYTNQAWLGIGPRSADDGFRLAREMANKALAVDPDYAPAHAHLGWIAMAYDADLTTAERHLEYAVARDPADAYVIANAAELISNLGRRSAAIELAEYVAARDPLNPGGHGDLAFQYYLAGRLEDAIASARGVLAFSPDSIGPHYRIGVSMLLKGDASAALKEMQAEPNEGWRQTGLALVYHALGKKAESDTALAELIKKHEKSWSSSAAWVLAFRGEADAAFIRMEKAIAYHDAGVVHFHIEPLLSNLHNDPRWLPFLQKLGLTKKQLAAIKFDVKVPD